MIFKYNSYTCYEKKKLSKPKVILTVKQFYGKANHYVNTKKSVIN